MSKKNLDETFETSDEVVATETVEATEAEKLEKFKQSKREAAQRFKEKRAKEKEERQAAAKEVLEYLKSNGQYDSFPEVGKKLLEGIANPVSNNTPGAQSNSKFSILFGTGAGVGASVTLLDAITKTQMGKKQLDALTKKWAKQGTIVAYHAADNALESTYVIEAIGAPVTEEAAE